MADVLRGSIFCIRLSGFRFSGK